MNPRLRDLSSELAESLADEFGSANDDSFDTLITGEPVEPTASKTDRFLGCAWPWGRPATDNEVGFPARFGSAYHEAMELSRKGKKFRWALIAKKWGADIEVESLKERVSKSLPVLKRWLAGSNPWKIDFTKWKLSYETALAYNMLAETARECQKPDERHRYTDRKEGEIPGTVDLFGVGNDGRKPKPGYEKMRSLLVKQNAVLIVDYKSGFDVGSPIDSGQLRTLALAACRLYGVERAYIAYLHAPATFEPNVYADSLDADDLRRHADALVEAHRRRGDGTLKPDYYCRYCAVFSICPTNQKALIEIRLKSALKTPEDAGAAYAKLKVMDRRYLQLRSIVDAEIRRVVEREGFAMTPDGRSVEFVEREYESLSKTNLMEALGPEKGGRELNRLRKLGVVQVKKRKELRPR